MNAAVDLEWAHFTYLQMLPVALNGPIALPMNIAVGIGWAHCNCLLMLPFPLNGPIEAS